MRLLNSTSDVIAELGGLQAVADLFGVTYKAAHNWKATGKFPTRTYVGLTDALRKRGCQAPATLWAWSETPSATVGAAS